MLARQKSEEERKARDMAEREKAEAEKVARRKAEEAKRQTAELLAKQKKPKLKPGIGSTPTSRSRTQS